MAPYIFSMSHNNDGVIDLGEESISKSKPPLDDDEGGVGGLKSTLHLVKPLVIVILFPISRWCSLSTMNLNPNLGIPLKIQSQKNDTHAMVQIKFTRMLNLLWFNEIPKT